MSGEKSLAAQRIKQRKLDKIRIMIFGCRKEWPKTTLSGDSLACTSKSSQVVDVSSSRSDIGRIPAGGFAPCGCPMDTGPSNSTQSLFTCEVSTQTEDNERKSTNETEPRASAESVSGRKDVATQSSFTELQNNPRRSSKTNYNIVSTRFLPSSYIINQECEPQSDADSVAEKHPQKWSFRRPLIVVDRGLPRISGAKSQMPTNQAMSDPQTRDQRTRGQSARDQRSGSNSRGNQQSRNQPTRNQQKSQKKPNRKQSTVAFEQPQQQRQRQGQGQNRSNLESESSATSFATSNQSEAEASAKKDIYTQSEDQVPRTEKPAASYPCSRIPELLNRVCKLETKLKNQEQALRSLQCAMKASKPPNCSVNQPPKKCETACKAKCAERSIPKCAEQSTQKCADQSTQKCDKEPTDCQTLKKEFIDIFIKTETSATSACSQKDIKKPIGICPAKNSCEDSRTMYLQCVEDSDTLIQQFNQKFAKPKNCKGEKNKSPCPEKCSPCLSVLTKQCITEPESGNMLDKCVGLVAKNSNVRKSSSASCLAENKVGNPCDSRQSLKKEVYESVLEQFVKNFPNPSMEYSQNLAAAQKPEGERYLFERLCAELVSLFTKPKNLEPCAVKEEDKLKRVTISENNTIREKDKLSEKPCKVEKICKDPAVSPGGCPSCSDSGNLPVLDSLVDELMKLIDCRPFRDVVLIITRRGCNIYHINIREMATGNVLGCLLANEAAITEAMSLGLFEDIHTFCELDKQSTKDALVPQREPGGETQLDSRDKEKAMAFVTRVLGLQAGEAERFFFLTNALKSVKKSSDQSLVGPESSGATENTGLIGRGAITGNLVFLGNVHNAPGTSGSQSDMSGRGIQAFPSYAFWTGY